MPIEFLALAINAFPLVIFLDYHRKENIHVGIIYCVVFYVNFSALWVAVRFFEFDILYALPAIFPLVFLLAWLKPPAERQTTSKKEDVLDQ